MAFVLLTPALAMVLAPHRQGASPADGANVTYASHNATAPLPTVKAPVPAQHAEAHHKEKKHDD